MDEEASEALPSMKLLLMSLRKDDSRGGGTRMITTTLSQARKELCGLRAYAQLGISKLYSHLHASTASELLTAEVVTILKIVCVSVYSMYCSHPSQVLYTLVVKGVK